MKVHQSPQQTILGKMLDLHDLKVQLQGSRQLNRLEICPLKKRYIIWPDFRLASRHFRVNLSRMSEQIRGTLNNDWGTRIEVKTFAGDLVTIEIRELTSIRIIR